jgi:DNA (cytosine-5)-methyltransferase 1
MSQSPKRPRTVTVTDLFCGAGGSSTGAQQALDRLGMRMRLLAVNHWPVAIETHQKNHPHAVHYCQDVATIKPHLAVASGRLDLLMASPTCIYHSRARGGRPTSDQQRMDPWHIVTWLTELRVRCLLVENVPEFVDWTAVDVRTGRPITSRRGEYFQRWVETIKGLGFAVDWRILNAADYGDATTRHRFFLIARSDGKPLRWPTPTHTKNPQQADLFGSHLQPWRPARDIIDWSVPGTSIFTRKRPLSPKTLARIYAGALKFRWPEPFLVILRNHMAAQGVDLPLPAITAGGKHIGLAQPFLFANRTNNIAKDPNTDPVPTICSRGNAALVEPFIATVAHGNAPREKNPDARRCRSLNQPLQTIHAGGGKFGLVEPFIINRHGENGSVRAHKVADPMPTATCRGAGYLVRPFIFRMNQGKHRFGEQRPIDDPLCTITTSGTDLGLVEPFVLSQASGGAPRATDEPLPSMTCDGAHALIAPYYGSGSGETCSSVKSPLPTVTTKARFGMAMPVTHHGRGNRARDVARDPLPTITGANRGELAFITANFGERDGQAPRVHSIDDPTPTICAQGGVVLVRPGRDFDILFRMLEPHELAAAMGFTSGESRYEFTGTKTDVVRQIGNAVPVNLAAALVEALMSPL